MNAKKAELKAPKGPKTCAVLKGDYLSLSPKLHTAGYKALGKEKEFEYNELTSNIGELKSRIAEFKNINNGYVGVSVGAPFKQDVMKYLDAIDDAAKSIGAVNTIVIEKKKGKTYLKGTNTDWIGFVDAIKEIEKLTGKKIAIVGAGGAARASIFGAKKEKPSQIKIFNRTLTKARKLAKEFDVEFGSIKELKDLPNFDIVVNATSVGMHNEKPFIDVRHIKKGQVVVEWDYSRELPETKLEKAAAKKGARVVSGRMILLHQAKGQFGLFTHTPKKRIPISAMRKVIYETT